MSHITQSHAVSYVYETFLSCDMRLTVYRELNHGIMVHVRHDVGYNVSLEFYVIVVIKVISNSVYQQDLCA